MEDCRPAEKELARLEAVRALGPFGSWADAELDAMAALARATFLTAAAAVTLVDDRQVWFAAASGLEPGFFTRDGAFCAQAVASGEMLVVDDARLDRRFAENSLAAGDPPFLFYAGVPISLEPGVAVGSLAILDVRPRYLEREGRRLLAEMATVVAALLRRRRDIRVANELVQDLDRQRRLNRAQAAALEHGRKIFDRSSAFAKVGVWECDLASETLSWSDGVYDLFELPRGSVVTREQTLALYAPESRIELGAVRAKAIRERSGFNLDAQIVTAKGARRWMRLTANVESENGAPVRIFGMKQDITEQKTLLERTRVLAERDMLTGLANRSLFQSRLSRLLEEQAAPESVGALMLVDLDGFKQVNDTFGHAAGDECLKAMAARLQHVCGGAELVARMGGDEFAILVGPGVDDGMIENLAERLLVELRLPVRWREQSFQVSASIGVTRPADLEGYTLSRLVTEADLALYAAKAGGRNTFRIFAPDMKSKADARLTTIRTVGEALADDRLDLFYQPKVRLFDGRHAGVEALLRWRAPDGEVRSASAFKAAFEDPELSGRIGRWVIGKALGQARRWREAGRRFGHVAINVGSAELRDPRFADDLIARIAEHDLTPEMIEVELTESVLLSQEASLATRTLERLKREGVRIALDHFGTGYASLVHLKTHPIDIIKIDRSFVKNLLTCAQDRAILEATIGLGLRLGLDIVADGVESDGQRDILAKLGCKQGQGFLFSPAVPAAEAERWFLEPPDALSSDRADLGREQAA